jgi:hypothetical protein
MDFAKGFSQIKKVAGVFAPTGSDKPVVIQSNGILYIRYAARLGILFLALFIFLWWPAESFKTESFNDWSTKMSALPDEVWYLILSIVLSWGLTEVMAARAIKNIPVGNQTPSYGGDDDFMDMNEDLDGRFGNLNDEDDFLSGPAETNTAIEEWRNETN